MCWWDRCGFGLVMGYLRAILVGIGICLACGLGRLQIGWDGLTLLAVGIGVCGYLWRDVAPEGKRK